jgi:hypothetical protein
MNWTLYWAVMGPLWIASVAMYLWRRRTGDQRLKGSWLRVVMILTGCIIGALVGYLVDR